MRVFLVLNKLKVEYFLRSAVECKRRSSAVRAGLVFDVHVLNY